MTPMGAFFEGDCRHRPDLQSSMDFAELLTSKIVISELFCILAPSSFWLERSTRAREDGRNV